MLNMVSKRIPKLCESTRTWNQKLIDALIDSGVVGGITALSTGFLTDPTIMSKAALASFLVAFLVKLRSIREDGKNEQA